MERGRVESTTKDEEIGGKTYGIRICNWSSVFTVYIFEDDSDAFGFEHWFHFGWSA
jgi:hypothetical protein